MGLKNFNEFERLYEANKVLDGSVLNEGEFEKYAKDLAADNKEDLTALNPMLNEYYKIRKDAMNKRVKVNQDIIKETDATKKEKLNNDLVKVNQDEEKKLEQNAKKLAGWAEDKTAVLKSLMKGRMKEIDLEMMQEEYKKLQQNLSDIAKKRMEDMIEAEEEAMKGRIEKMDKMMADENADTKAEDEKIKKAETKKGDVEQDYDASGDVSPAEKKARQQRDKKAADDILNQI